MPSVFSANTMDFRRDEPEPDNVMFSETPIYARARSRKAATRGKVPMAALVAIPAAVLAIGGVAYFMTQPRSTEVAEATAPVIAPPAAVEPMTPTEPLAVNPTPTPLMQEVNPAPAVRAATPRAETPRRAQTRVAQARTRPAAPAASADEVGVDASATVPTGPVPYSTLPGAVTPGPVNPVVPVAPEAAPATPLPTDPVNPPVEGAPVP
jgi:hypothetical protein